MSGFDEPACELPLLIAYLLGLRRPERTPRFPSVRAIPPFLGVLIGWQHDPGRKDPVGNVHGVATAGLGRLRYPGLAKTRLENINIACAINLWRRGNFWQGISPEGTGISSLAPVQRWVN